MFNALSRVSTYTSTVLEAVFVAQTITCAGVWDQIHALPRFELPRRTMEALRESMCSLTMQRVDRNCVLSRKP